MASKKKAFPFPIPVGILFINQSSKI